MSDPRLLVVLLNYRTPQMTLRAAKAALADMPETAELVIVDNASGDGSMGIFEQALADWDLGARVRLILSGRNGGFGAGCNIGLAEQMSDGSAPDFFYLLNSDAFPDPGCIATLLDHMARHPRAGFAASHVRGEDDLPHTTAFRFPSIAGEFEGAVRFGPVSRLLAHAIVAPPLPEKTTRVDWAAGASVMIRAATLEEIGRFDETFFLYFEETDLMKRGARAGWSCWYVPEARVVHIGSVSTGMKEWQRMPAYWFASRRHYFIKTHGRAYAAAAWGARLTGSALHALRCTLTGRNPQDPAFFTRDLARHGLGLRSRSGRATARRPVSEDRT
ncbi:glycosyltransferase family 2 protein [Sulfitobacter sp. PR48]|uniref:glycosyltransferase family 2 protein n=1 Tax=Sulfitobacter sp. PR48 TaxID=3028383 RepID=UPI00237A93A2|nr:glycosyltransferase family 2 protein [Sulfitobacter sp. PR48]MDD9723549.1 glycosyltransferase family 2 protein [Sulfitobacter sp. PR48]